MTRIYFSIISLMLVLSHLCTAAQEKLILSYTAPKSDQLKLLADKKILPVSATTSSQQNGEGIEKSFDGDMSSIYHSAYNSTTFPVTLQYRFKSVKQIDYLIYYPRQNGSNGNFHEIEVWYMNGSGTKNKLGDYDLKGSADPYRINFATPIIDPIRIEFIVKSGEENLVSCAEMEFYERNKENDSFLSFFQDKTASELKGFVTYDLLEKIPNLYLREYAQDVYNQNYSIEGRIGEFKPYQHLNTLGKNRIAYAYNRYENPTGIYFPQGEHVLIVEGIEPGQQASLLIPDFRFWDAEKGEYRGGIISATFPLKNGINMINVKDWDGLGYVSYFTDTPEQRGNIKIHFINSTVHGYFDITKHTNSDWQRLINNATDYPAFDLVGRHCQLTFPVEDYKNYTQNKPVELINAYDSVVTYQQRFIGLEKYNKRPKNRIMCRVNYTYFMFKDGNGAAFEKSTLSYVVNPDLVFKRNWGMSHEIGHIHQMEFVTWAGMGEVSVNFPNIYINHMYPSRETSNMSQKVAREGMAALYNKNIPHVTCPDATAGSKFYHRLTPFAILYHYMRHVRSNPDFFADIYESFRSSTEDTTGWKTADYELYFVQTACNAAQLNLVPYFEAWGFLYRTDIAGRQPFEVEDYSNGYYELPTSKVDALKAYISRQQYPTPAVSDIVCDNVINQMTNVDK